MNTFKRFLGIITLLWIVVATSSAQTTILSNGTGGGRWDSIDTWVGGIVPTLLDSVVVQGTDSVFFNAAVPESCYSLTILNGGIFAVIYPDTFGVKNVFTLEANTKYYNGSPSAKVPGTFYVLDNTSTVIHQTASSVGGGDNLTFGNLVVSAAQGVTAGGDLVINGDLTIRMAGVGNTFRAVSKADSNEVTYRVCTVHGNVYLYQGQWTAVDYGHPNIIGAEWNIDGDVLVKGDPVITNTARLSTFTSAFPVGVATFNIHGNLTIDGGGRLCAGSSSSRGYGTGIINLYKDFSLINGGRTTTNHKGPFALNFVGTGTQTVRLDTNFYFNQEPAFDTIAATSNVVFMTGKSFWSSLDTVGGAGGGAFVVNGSLTMVDSSRLQGTASFTLNSGATLKLASKDGIAMLPDSTHGNIRVTGARTFSPDANYEFNGSVAQKTGAGMATTMNNFSVNNSAGVTLTNSSTVNGIFSITGGDLTTGANTVTLGSVGQLIETAGNTIIGTIQTTRTVSQNVAESFGGLGVTLNAAGNDPGSTSVTRVTGVASSFYSHHSILRYFDIVPTNNSGLNATVDYYYDNSELNSQNASTLSLWNSDDNGTTWLGLDGIVDTTLRRIRSTGVNTLARLTAADASNSLDAVGFTYGVLGAWNMLSLPLNVIDPAKTTIFPTAISNAFSYNNSYVTAASLVPGLGYWLKFGSPQNVEIIGGPITSDTIPLAAGWNMIGSINDSVPVASIIQEPSGCVSSSYYAYNNGYISTSIIAPLQGYWVKANAGGGQLILNSPGLQKNSSTTSNELESFNTITITDKKGISQILYIGAQPTSRFDVTKYEMPPSPPVGILDARFVSQRMVETYPDVISKAIEYAVSIQSAEYPVTVSWKISDATKLFTVVGTDVKQQLKGEGKFVMNTPNSRLRLVVSGDVTTPKQYAMSDNYPNPFNPTTMIDVALPVQSRLSVRIYNTLGEEVAELASGIYGEGFHSFSWSGVNNASIQMGSGVYYYKLDATSLVDAQHYSVVKKMVFMK